MSRFAPPLHLPPMEALREPPTLHRTGLFLGFLLIGCAAAAAQPPLPAPPAPPVPPASGEPLPRRDAFFFIGFRGATFDSSYFSGFEWDGRFAYGGTAGYYLTPNLKVEADLSGTSPSRFVEYTQRPVEGQAYPSFYPSEHRVVSASLRGMAIYQFFENASFHPDGDRVRRHRRQTETRIARPERRLPLTEIEFVEMQTRNGSSIARAVGIGLATGAGAFLGLMLLAIVIIED